MFALKPYLLKKQTRINELLDEVLPGSEVQIVSAMRYSLMAGGKRLRPILCMAAAEAVGGNETAVLQAACALEMIHTYSLIHDDLPAMDNDQMRRGRPTLHMAFDEATAILAGDALLTYAFKILSSNHNETGGLTDKKAGKRLMILERIADAAGFKGMIAGQMMDIDSEGHALTNDELQALHLKKTGALIQASVFTGAVLGNGEDKQIEALEEYGRHIGLAFQVADDILNVEGDPEIMGKAVGTDQHRKKSTYPALLGLDNSKAFARSLAQNALQALDIFDTKSDPLRAIANYIVERRQ